jgi:xanthine/uracil permease
MDAINPWVVLWLLGMLASGIVCTLRWEKGTLYRLVPIAYGITAGLVSPMIHLLEFGNANGTLGAFSGSVVIGIGVSLSIWIQLWERSP